MIYISSSCIKVRSIKEAIEKIYSWGYTNIELSGGTQPYPGITDDLLSLKEKYKLNLLCHNYFPPPQENFVLNLASLNEDIYHKSVEHVKNAIELSSLIGAEKYAVHAGFLIDIPLSEIGKSIGNKGKYNTEEAKSKFIETIRGLLSHAEENNIQLYIENNVISYQNYQNFEKSNPFFLVNQIDAEQFRQQVPGIKILADLAHLKVSSATLGLDFTEQARYFIENTDYIHVSDNDGKADTNGGISELGNIYSVLKNADFKNKTITLEVYEDEQTIHKSFQLISELL